MLKRSRNGGFIKLGTDMCMCVCVCVYIYIYIYIYTYVVIQICTDTHTHRKQTSIKQLHLWDIINCSFCISKKPADWWDQF